MTRKADRMAGGMGEDVEREVRPCVHHGQAPEIFVFGMRSRAVALSDAAPEASLWLLSIAVNLEYSCMHCRVLGTMFQTVMWVTLDSEVKCKTTHPPTALNLSALNTFEIGAPVSFFSSYQG